MTCWSGSSPVGCTPIRFVWGLRSPGRETTVAIRQKSAVLGGILRWRSDQMALGDDEGGGGCSVLVASRADEGGEVGECSASSHAKMEKRRGKMGRKWGVGSDNVCKRMGGGDATAGCRGGSGGRQLTEMVEAGNGQANMGGGTGVGGPIRGRVRGPAVKARPDEQYHFCFYLKFSS
jgi:hypothetical protein